MSVLSDNMRVLRDRMAISQQKTADHLKITRGRYVKYEDGSSEPPIEILIRIARFFGISIDLLLTVDIRKYPLDNIAVLPDNRMVLPIMVDGKGENKIEVITQKASMGYLNGYMDPGYIESLQTLSLPFLRNGKYRAFPAGGDSMPPFKDGTFIVGKYVEDLRDLKPGKTYILVTQDEGVTYKRMQELKGHSVKVSADNSFYEPYEIHFSGILEVWEYACAISTKEFDADEFSGQNVKEMFVDLKKDLKAIMKAAKK